MLVFSRPISLGNDNSFDKAIQNLRNAKPELFEEKAKSETIPSKTTAVDDSFYERLDKAIDILAVSVALLRISHRYYTLKTCTNDENSTLNKVLSYTIPSFIPSLYSKIILVKETGIITLETIIYKTIAKMLLYCAKGDAYDLTKKLLYKIQSIVLW